MALVEMLTTLPPLAEALRRFSHEIECPFEVDGNLTVKRIVVHVRNSAQQHHSSVNNNRIDASELCFSQIEHVLGAPWVSHISTADMRVHTNSLNAAGNRVRIGAVRTGVVQDDIETVLSQPRCNGGTDAARPSGNDRNLPEISHLQEFHAPNRSVIL